MVAIAGFILSSVTARATWTVTPPLSIQEYTGISGQFLEMIKIGEFVSFHIRSWNKTLQKPSTPKA